MGLDDLTPEQREKAKACKSAEELEVLVAEEGMRLSADELKALSGGDLCIEVCYKRGSSNPTPRCRNNRW